MRNISFQFTQRQISDESKDVTRRMGWLKLKANELLQGVEKGMGLKPGEKVKKLKVIRVKSARRERLDRMIKEPAYGRAEVIREGFPEMTPREFVQMFCRTHQGCTPSKKVTRIEFEYV